MGPARLLVVEDESITRAAIGEFLRREGYVIEEARDGGQAVELFEGQRFDLVITDLVMPKLNGFKLIARVHSMSPATPIILITGYLARSSGKAILAGTAEFIGKPVDLDVLLATVKHLLTEA